MELTRVVVLLLVANAFCGAQRPPQQPNLTTASPNSNTEEEYYDDEEIETEDAAADELELQKRQQLQQNAQKMQPMHAAAPYYNTFLPPASNQQPQPLAPTVRLIPGGANPMAGGQQQGAVAGARGWVQQPLGNGVPVSPNFPSGQGKYVLLPVSGGQQTKQGGQQPIARPGGQVPTAPIMQPTAPKPQGHQPHRVVVEPPRPREQQAQQQQQPWIPQQQPFGPYPGQPNIGQRLIVLPNNAGAVPVSARGAGGLVQAPPAAQPQPQQPRQPPQIFYPPPQQPQQPQQPYPQPERVPLYPQQGQAIRIPSSGRPQQVIVPSAGGPVLQQHAQPVPVLGKQGLNSQSTLLPTSHQQPLIRPPLISLTTNPSPPTDESDLDSSPPEQQQQPASTGRPVGIHTPHGKMVLEPYFENYCDNRLFTDDILASKNLQRVEYFIANLTCSRYFFECAVGQTFLLNCTSTDQVFDSQTVNCNFKYNVKSCSEFDHILHCSIQDECQADQFACCAPPQQCIPYVKRCDGVVDCADGEDENNCPACDADEFPCVKSGKCISSEKRCNGVPDECFDQTNLDELNCGACPAEKFTCGRTSDYFTNGPICIDWNLRCNGARDCPKGEDELNCKSKGPKYLLCENQKQSVSKDQWCDGYEDCLDGSDEKYCIYK